MKKEADNTRDTELWRKLEHQKQPKNGKRICDNMEWVFVWLLCAITAGMIGARKGIGGSAFILGFLFGPFGILFALFMTGNRRECPACKTMIHAEASICPMCRTTIEPGQKPEQDERQWRGSFQDRVDRMRTKRGELKACTVAEGTSREA